MGKNGRWTVSGRALLPSFQLFTGQGFEKLRPDLNLPLPGTGLPVKLLFLDRHQADHGLLPSHDNNLLALAGFFDQPRELRLRFLNGDCRHLTMLAQSGLAKPVACGS